MSEAWNHAKALYPRRASYGMVVCEAVEFFEDRNDIISNPMLIIEVLSPTTQAFDRGKKFKYYRSIPSLKEYVLISQEEPLVESYFRQDGKTWLYTVVRGLDDKVVLLSMAHEIELKEIYRKVAFEDKVVLESGN